MTTAAELSTARALTAAEDSGFKIAVKAHMVAVLLAGAWLDWAVPTDAWPVALAPVALLLLAGVAAHAAVGSRFDWSGSRYAILGLDAAGLAALLVLLPDAQEAAVVGAFGPAAALLLIGLAAAMLARGPLIWAGALGVALCWMPMTGGVVPSGWALPPLAVPAGASLIAVAATGLVGWAIARLRAVVAERASAGRARGRIQTAFGRYMPASMVEELVRTPGVLKPVERDASIVQVVVSGFTTLTEAGDPATGIAVLDAFFTRAGEIVAEGGGVIAGATGTGFTASFNLPLAVNDHPDRALWVARALLHAVRKESFAGARLELRIGVATGPVSAGAVGGERPAYAVYGDTLDRALRLQALNTELQSRVLLDADTASGLSPETDLRKIGAVELRGREASVAIFGV
ncbi:adenylate/guanylate cyclase domain-containing protein [Amorphus coralli]|uniref:adenylate/guanylate cyclase domain-containing protein n=1 Tax=Amorphus coralli TaxID=340680 RepID=UPI00036E8FDD|nr:adenylate/guanylate cyclase domain-containing protein [Amorphus coralli]